MSQIKKQRYKSTLCAPESFSWSTHHSAGCGCHAVVGLPVPSPLSVWAFLLWDGDSFEDTQTETNDSRDEPLTTASLPLAKVPTTTYNSQTSKLPSWRCKVFVSFEVWLTWCNSQTLNLSKKHLVILELAIHRYQTKWARGVRLIPKRNSRRYMDYGIKPQECKRKV